MKHALVCALLTLAGCAAPTAADKGRFAEAAIVAGHATCLVLAADQSIPRSERTQAHCDKVLSHCRQE